MLMLKNLLKNVFEQCLLAVVLHWFWKCALSFQPNKVLQSKQNTSVLANQEFISLVNERLFSEIQKKPSCNLRCHESLEGLSYPSHPPWKKANKKKLMEQKIKALEIIHCRTKEILIISTSIWRHDKQMYLIWTKLNNSQSQYLLQVWKRCENHTNLQYTRIVCSDPSSSKWATVKIINMQNRKS